MVSKDSVRKTQKIGSHFIFTHTISRSTKFEMQASIARPKKGYQMIALMKHRGLLEQMNNYETSSEEP